MTVSLVVSLIAYEVKEIYLLIYLFYLFIYLPPSASDPGEFEDSDKRELVDPR